jgi:hypothetical protein
VLSKPAAAERRGRGQGQPSAHYCRRRYRHARQRLRQDGRERCDGRPIHSYCGISSLVPAAAASDALTGAATPNTRKPRAPFKFRQTAVFLALRPPSHHTPDPETQRSAILSWSPAVSSTRRAIHLLPTSTCTYKARQHPYPNHTMHVLARLCRKLNRAETTVPLLRKADGCAIVGRPIVVKYRFQVTRRGDYIIIVAHITASDGIVMMTSNHYNNVANRLRPIKVIQDSTRSVTPELVTCGTDVTLCMTCCQQNALAIEVKGVLAKLSYR